MGFIIEKDSSLSDSVTLNYHRVMYVSLSSRNDIRFGFGGFISKEDSDNGFPPIPYHSNVNYTFVMPWASFNQALPAFPQVYNFIKTQPGWEDAEDDSQQLVQSKG